MTPPEHINHNWGAPVHDDDHAHHEEVAVVPHHSRNLMPRESSAESYDEMVEQRKALRAALGKLAGEQTADGEEK